MKHPNDSYPHKFISTKVKLTNNCCFQVFRRIDQGNGHSIALELERGKPQDQQVEVVGMCKAPTQKRITTMTQTFTTEAYKKLFRTAYELSLNPTLPLRQFKTLVKVQTQNGVRLIEGIVMF